MQGQAWDQRLRGQGDVLAAGSRHTHPKRGGCRQGGGRLLTASVSHADHRGRHRPLQCRQSARHLLPGHPRDHPDQVQGHVQQPGVPGSKCPAARHTRSLQGGPVLGAGPLPAPHGHGQLPEPPTLVLLVDGSGGRPPTHAHTSMLTHRTSTHTRTRSHSHSHAHTPSRTHVHAHVCMHSQTSLVITRLVGDRSKADATNVVCANEDSAFAHGPHTDVSAGR